jgi:hypothetical protein
VRVDQVLEPEPVGVAEISLSAEMNIEQRQVDPVPLDQRRELGQRLRLDGKAHYAPHSPDPSVTVASWANRDPIDSSMTRCASFVAECALWSQPVGPFSRLL